MKIYQQEWISLLILGDIEMNLGNYKEALQAFDKALLMKPDSIV